MSYSFALRAASKAEAKMRASAKCAEVLQNQPSHADDMADAERSAHAAVDLLPDADDHDVVMNCSGSVSWRGTWGVDHMVTGVNISVSASLVQRQPAA